MITLEQRKVQLQNLIDKFDKDKKYYLSNRYNETQLRTDFLDEFFSILGWDITNRKSNNTNEREVLVEESLKANSNENSKKPDYTFRLFSERKFFLEAKKPNVNITNLDDPSKQIRRYGFTAKLKISVLSNFLDTIIFDCSQPVDQNDTAQHARIKHYHYTDLVNNLDEIERFIGRDSVYSGNFDKEWEHIEDKILRCSVDDLFLNQINNWRVALAKEFLGIKPDLDDDALNDIVQSYINSIVFLRVCEDRDLEDNEALYNLSASKNYKGLITSLKNADQRYNAGLFQLEHIDIFFQNSDSVIWEIIKQLYFPESIYSFSVFSSYVLGSIYEVFLSKKIKNANNNVLLVDKPENIDRDIVTTPSYIIREILKKTLVEYCKGKNDQEIMSLKIADIACGSGAFLLEAFQIMQDILIDYYLANQPNKLIQTSPHSYKLSFDDKKNILCNCFYGFDKDYNAVKACAFGLLLKLLENESKNTILNFHKILPQLGNNIIYANSLIDFNDNFNQAHIKIINPYDIQNHQFDIIIGNPPYMATEHMKQLTRHEFDIYKDKFKSAHKQFDKYFLFLERSLDLLKPNGCMGYIVPSKFMKVGAGKNLRDIIASQKFLYGLSSFGSYQVFKNKTTYTCLVFLKKAPQNTFFYQEVKDLGAWIAQAPNSSYELICKANTVNSDTWILEKDTQDILDRMSLVCMPLEQILGSENISNGIQTSANQEYIHKPINDDGTYVTFKYDDSIFQIEKTLTRPYYAYSNTDSLFTYKDLEPNSFVVFPYEKVNNHINLISYTDLKKNFPKTYHFLNYVKPQLNNPKRSISPPPQNNNEWYRYGRSQALENCEVDQKIIVGVLSKGYKYSIDKNKTFVSSGGTAGYSIINIPTGCQYSIYYIQAVLSSRYMEWFASVYGEVFRGGYVARGTKNQKRMLIPLIDFNDSNEKRKHDDIMNLQIKMNNLYKSICTSDERSKITLQRQFKNYETIMDDRIKELYQLGVLDAKVPSIEDLYKNL